MILQLFAPFTQESVSFVKEGSISEVFSFTDSVFKIQNPVCLLMSPFFTTLSVTKRMF